MELVDAFRDALQQYLPFTVLKHGNGDECMAGIGRKLQQYLPFTVLKHITVIFLIKCCLSCNSTYRLRY